MAADLTVHSPLRLKNIALNRSAACVLDLTRIDEGGSAGMAPARFDWDRSQAEQDRAAGAGEHGQGRLHPHPPRSHPSSFAAAGWEPWCARRPCDWQPADGGGALEFISQACLSEGASLPDTALSESWEWLVEPIC